MQKELNSLLKSPGELFINRSLRVKCLNAFAYYSPGNLLGISAKIIKKTKTIC